MRGWATKLVALAAVLIAIGFVGLAVGGGWLYWNRMELRSEQATRAELAPLAAKQIPEVFGYDYQTVERSLTAAASLLAPDYRREVRGPPSRDTYPRARRGEG